MGHLNPALAVVSAVPVPPKLASWGRPRSGKVKVTVAVCESVAHRLKLIPDGTREQTVGRALVLVFDGPGVSDMERLIGELGSLSVSVIKNVPQDQQLA